MILLQIVMGPHAGLASVAVPSEDGDSCGVRIREARPDEKLVRERNPLLGAPEDANNAPGPGALRAVVRGGRPAIFILDTVAGTSRQLCPGSMPRFSPDGRWIACSRWLSSERPYMLALVDARTGNSRIVDRVGQIDDYAWSPDSRRLAFTSIPRDTSLRLDIGWIEIGSAAVHVLASDRDPNVEWLELEWAPDSHRFLVKRHRESEHDDSVYASDLWLFDVNNRPCRLTHTPAQEENSSGWIDDRRIRYESGGSNDESGGGLRYVIELEPTSGTRPKR